MGLTLDRFERDAVRLDSHEPPTRPGGPEIREVRPASRGLLMLYPLLLTKDKEAVPGVLAPTAGFGVSFPNSNTVATVTYIVANKYWEQEFAVGALDE